MCGRLKITQVRSTLFEDVTHHSFIVTDVSVQSRICPIFIKESTPRRRLLDLEDGADKATRIIGNKTPI
jgi:hypothetical protein